MDSTERGRNANDTGAGEEVIGSDSKELNPSVNGECFFCPAHRYFAISKSDSVVFCRQVLKV